MIIHLESGACASEIEIIDLNESAAECYQWKAYLDADYRDDLLNRRNLDFEYTKPAYAFRCPKCDTGFTKLSGLFQHVESKACNQGLYAGKMGKLVRWLESQLCASGSE